MPGLNSENTKVYNVWPTACSDSKHLRITVGHPCSVFSEDRPLPQPLGMSATQSAGKQLSWALLEARLGKWCEKGP